MPEYFDILDTNGNPTGEKKIRAKVHKNGDWHKSVDVWIINPKKELLIQKRSPNKECYPNLWEVSCSGHANSGENGMKAAIRELQEELGVDADEKQLEFLFEDKEINITNNGTFINKEFKEVYLLKLDLPIEKYNIQKEEISEIKFVPLKKLKTAIRKNPENFVPHDNLYKKFFTLMGAA